MVTSSLRGDAELIAKHRFGDSNSSTSVRKFDRDNFHNAHMQSRARGTYIHITLHVFAFRESAFVVIARIP